MKEQFIENWLNKLEKNYDKEYFTYKMTKKDATFTIEWKKNIHVQLINSEKGTCNTLPIKRIKELFFSYDGKNIDHPKSGLYWYFKYLIAALYKEYTETYLKKDIKKERSFKEQVEIAKTLMEFKREDGTSYFHPDYIAREVLGITSKEISKNKEFWKSNGTSKFES